MIVCEQTLSQRERVAAKQTGEGHRTYDGLRIPSSVMLRMTASPHGRSGPHVGLLASEKVARTTHLTVIASEAKQSRGLTWGFWIASPSARNDEAGVAGETRALVLPKPQPRHCEERSDAAIHLRVAAPRWIATSPSALRNDEAEVT